MDLCFGLVKIRGTISSGFNTPVLSEMSCTRGNASYDAKEMSLSFLIGIMVTDQRQMRHFSHTQRLSHHTRRSECRSELYAVQARRFHDVTVSAHAEQQLCEEARCASDPFLPDLAFFFFFFFFSLMRRKSFCFGFSFSLSFTDPGDR